MSDKSKLNSLKNTKKNQIKICCFWFLVEIIAFGIFYEINFYNVVQQIITISIMGLSISILWIMFRWTLFEKTMLKLKNYTNEYTAKRINEEYKKSDLKEYEKFRKNKSWWGIVGLSSINGIMLLIGLIANI